MNKSLKVLALTIMSTTLIAVGLVSSPANAVSPLTVTVSKTANLALTGETVSVSVSGIPTGQGIYVYQCASAVASPRPASTLCRSGMSESLWLTNTGGQGAGVASQQNQLSLLKEFTIGSTTFNCSVDTCGIFARRDHMGGSTDLSLDTIVPISFVTPAVTPTPTPTPSVTTTPTPATTAAPKLKKAVATKFGFDSGSSTLSPQVKSGLKKKLSDYQLATTVTLKVEVGLLSGVSNKSVANLAKNRATAIKKYLVKLGVSSEKIVIETKAIKPGIKPSSTILATP